MANTKSAKKRTRQTITKTARNSAIITAVKGQQKKLREVLAKGNKEAAKVELQKLSSIWDKATKRGAVHKNATNRRKGSFAKAVAALS